MRWIFFAFLVIAVVQATSYKDDHYWDTNDEYTNYYDYNPFDDDTFKFEDKSNQETIKRIDSEIAKFKDADLDLLTEDAELNFHLNNLQIEDNREKPKDEENTDEKNNVAVVKDAASVDLIDHLKLLSGDDSIAPVPEENITIKNETESNSTENKEIIEPTSEIIEETKRLLDGVPDQMQLNVTIPEFPKTDEQPTLEEVIAETKKILKEIDDSMEENAEPVNDEISIKVTDEKDSKNDELIPEGDTVDKAYEDLNKDLDKLFSTLDKITHDDVDSEKSEKNASIELEDPNEFDNNNMEGSEETLLDEMKDTNHLFEEFSSAEIAELFNDEINKPNPEDSIAKNDTETVKSELKVHPIAYLDDALVDNDMKEVNQTNASVEKTQQKPVNLDDLSSAELEILNLEFIAKHGYEIDVKSPNFDNNVAPVHITLKVDEPTVITSPNYPSPYTTNNVIDWILEGNGMGIEMNITDFAINSAVGDYLLVKPGGVDETGHDGLIFSYQLNSVRRYRFFDVDRMFIRFQAMLGMMWMRGFSISLKMIAPRPNQVLDPLPEPDEVVLRPNVTAKLTLDISIPEFKLVQEDFRLILSDMITMYMEENSVVLNDMDESVKIVSTSSCPINWPNSEHCTAVTFAVILPEENDNIDLIDMWNKYKDDEPFVSQFAKIGISEMTPPDMSIMTVWLVIGAGVIISMAMLAFVLWRFTCFEDYTRMKNYSDTDSIADEKRGLDLYPTPHQTLPPLFANEYQFPELDSARVDMGGFTNKSYIRDTMYDFESDEEVVPPRDRNSGVSPRDFKSNP